MSESNKTIEFEYENYIQCISTKKILLKSETNTHFGGIDLSNNGYRTFKKERVVQYFEESDRHLTSIVTYISPEKLLDGSFRLAQGNPDELLEVCFTGFKKADKDALIELALKNKCHVVGDVSRNLSFLVCGYNAGPKKIERALNHSHKVEIMTQEDFMHFIETGEVIV